MTDPFELWRAAQRADGEATPTDEPVRLNEPRRARLELAIRDICDAHQTGDAQALTETIDAAVALAFRLHAEQLAEVGMIPPTHAGCAAVLDTAAAVLDELHIADDPRWHADRHRAIATLAVASTLLTGRAA